VKHSSLFSSAVSYEEKKFFKLENNKEGKYDFFNWQQGASLIEIFTRVVRDTFYKTEQHLS
jgi:hypothetical protein